jgi:hypothetical protein
MPGVYDPRRILVEPGTVPGEVDDLLADLGLRGATVLVVPGKLATHRGFRATGADVPRGQ